MRFFAPSPGPLHPIRRLVAGVVATALGWAPPPARADLIAEPAVFGSTGGVLDILMIAEAKPVPFISFSPPGGVAPVHPIGWVYEVCPRPPSGNQCPAGPSTVADYGGVRLALKAGDTLRIRLVNQLPQLDPAKVKHLTDPGQANLFRNPTNLHTHGLIVPARVPTLNDPTFGDDVFVQVYNSANGIPVPQTTHQHGSIKMDYIDYRIDIPSDHPPGLFWFHPHVHGLSLNQVSSGMAGIITIGDVRDYVKAAPSVVRHLILKDMQVLDAGTLQYASGPVKVSDGEVQNQQITDFCEQRDNGGPNSRHGFCEGQPDEQGSGNSFIGSRWYFTVNGQVFPTVRMTSSDGELWRITNASGQVSYRLNLVDDSTQKPMLLQLVAVDGVSIAVPPGTPAQTVMTIGGNKFTVADCPSGIAKLLPVCVRDLVMMPSSRAEVWVTYRNAQGTAVVPPPGATATLDQGLINLGPAAEAWPQVKLAKIEFAEPAMTKTEIDVAGDAIAVLSPKVALARSAQEAAAPAMARCRPLAAHHHRRIFFGVVDASDPHTPFGIGYEEIDDQTGAVVPGTQVPVTAFDPANALVCLSLGRGGTAVHETWELINLGTETHNFHVHQTKFRVLAGVPGLAPTLPVDADTPVIMEDNVPVPYAVAKIDLTSQQGYCTIDQWRIAQCKSTPVVVDIPFSQLGEFVFHCHILEHEDGGMMARIEVVPGP